MPFYYVGGAWVMSYAHIWNPVDRDVRQVGEMYSFILFF